MVGLGTGRREPVARCVSVSKDGSLLVTDDGSNSIRPVISRVR